jgi:hypothetical protein
MTKTKATKTIARPTKKKATKPAAGETETEGRGHPIMLRMSSAELADLDALAAELQRGHPLTGPHPALDALGGVITRSALIRLCIHRGKRELRGEVS